MLERFITALHTYPTFFKGLGALLLRVGGIGFIAGLVVHAGKVAASTATSMAGQPPVTSVQQLLPGLPTWWVPESSAGMFTYAAIAGIGLALGLAARDAKQQLKRL